MNTAAWLVVGAYLGILTILSTYGLHRLFIARVYWRHRHDHPPRSEPVGLPVVTVQLPVFNESNVVVRLIDAAATLDWPRERLEVQVLDDSTDHTVGLSRARASHWRSLGFDVRVIHRSDRVGFKAGALAAGAAVARGELLAVFDADFVPPADFLRRVVPAFDGFERGRVHRVGMVQARWGHLNESANLLTKLSAVLLDGHFVLEHTARNRSGRFFNFNGTAGVWRRQAVAQAGGWELDTLTEDLDLSYRAQLAGWRFVFLSDVVVPAELPADMRAFKLQQHRWAKGTVQTARKLLPRILASDLPLRVRLEALVHLTSNLAYPLVLAMAVLMPFSVAARGHGGLVEALLVDLPAFVLATASVALFYALAEREAHGTLRGRWWRLPLVMALGIGMSVSQTRAVVEGLFGRDVTFRRTPKSGDTGADGQRLRVGWTAFVELALAAWYLAAAGWSLSQGYWASLPFMVLFGAGFLFVGLSSVRPPRGSAGTVEGTEDQAAAAC